MARAEAPAHRRLRIGDGIFRSSSVATSAGLIALLVGMLGVLLVAAFPTFRAFGLKFVTGTQWNPVTDQFGALPYIYGTVVTSTIAIALALPVSLGLALLLNEVRSGWVRNPLTVLVDLLAAIPSVVYGLWGIFVMAPALNTTLEPALGATLGKLPLIGRLFQPTPSAGNMLNAGIILAVMVIPIITAVSREVIATVPRDLREAALSMGATRYEAIKMAVLPYARNGIIGATMLGLGRALGETIAVAMLIGNGLGISSSLLAPGYTIPAVIANEFREAGSTGLHRSSLIALAVILMLIALILAAASRMLVRNTAERFAVKLSEVSTTLEQP
ncbi:MAG TPA: phosphate ABC transporter permease subunit PstC [Coriobacteriia bacterium]